YRNHLGHPTLRFDLLDHNFRVRLTMTLLSAIVLLRLVFEDDHFLAFAMLFYFADNFRTRHRRCTSYKTFVSGYSYNLVERNGFAFASSELLHIDHIALLYFILLSASHNNRVHILHLLVLRLAKTWCPKSKLTSFRTFKTNPVRLQRSGSA